MRLALFIGALLTPAAAFAAEPSGGMPQFALGNPLTISQVLWMCVIFAVLYGVLAAWALPALGSVIEDRGRRIRTDLDAAKLAKNEADSAVAELTLATQRARAEAQGAIAQAVRQAREEAGRQSAALNQKLDTELKAAEARIGEARNAAMRALHDAARETAQAMIERLAGQVPEASVLDAAIAEALAGRGS